MTTTEHLLKQFAYTNSVSKEEFDDNSEMFKEIMMDHAIRDLSRQHLTIKSYTWHHTVVPFECEDGSIVDTVDIALVGFAYRLDESSDQTLRKMAIDEALRKIALNEEMYD